MPEVPNDGIRFTSEVATVADATLCAAVLAEQTVELQPEQFEAELIGLLIQQPTAT